MQRDLRVLLRDIEIAAKDIEAYTSGMCESDYESNSMVQAAVERKFIVIGEAMARISNLFPESLRRIGEASKVIGFRNILTHGYEIVEDNRVWSTTQDDLPGLLENVRKLLSELNDEKQTG